MITDVKLREYARAHGLDEDKVVAEFREASRKGVTVEELVRKYLPGEAA